MELDKELTPDVLAVKVPDDWPAAIVSEAGTDTEDKLLVRDTTAPFEPATPFNVTIPVDELPPTTVEGLRLNEASVAGVTVSTAVSDALPTVAVIVEEDSESTPDVLTVKVPVDCPAAIVNEDGTVETELLLLRLTTTPEGPEAPLRDTVPVELAPPGTVDGLRLKDERDAATIVNVAL